MSHEHICDVAGHEHDCDKDCVLHPEWGVELKPCPQHPPAPRRELSSEQEARLTDLHEKLMATEIGTPEADEALEALLQCMFNEVD